MFQYVSYDFPIELGSTSTTPIMLIGLPLLQVAGRLDAVDSFEPKPHGHSLASRGEFAFLLPEALGSIGPLGTLVPDGQATKINPTT